MVTTGDQRVMKVAVLARLSLSRRGEAMMVFDETGPRSPTAAGRSPVDQVHFPTPLMLQKTSLEDSVNLFDIDHSGKKLAHLSVDQSRNSRLNNELWTSRWPL